MKFGGHETFFLRPNWLTKGLLLVKSSEDLIWNSDAASDAMGVGRNMSKSIGWWLGRAGLAHRPARGEMIVLRPFGEAVLAHDRHLTRTATLWLLHLHMCLRGEADIFAWFFRHARDRRFSRDSLEGALRLHLEQAGDKPPAPKTLKRDVAVLLQTYARSISPRPIDPEDNLDCPLRRLGLVVHRSDLDVFERRDSTTALAPEVVASAICSLRTNTTSEFVTIVMDDMAAVRTLARVLGRAVWQERRRVSEYRKSDEGKAARRNVRDVPNADLSNLSDTEKKEREAEQRYISNLRKRLEKSSLDEIEIAARIEAGLAKRRGEK